MTAARLHLLGCTALVMALWAGLALGPVPVSWTDVAAAAAKQWRGETLSGAEALAWTVIVELRLPRALAAACCGAGLGAAGVLAQGLFRESLASPTVLGTEAGGSLAAATMFYLGGAFRHWLLLPAVSFAGALAASLLVFGVAARAAGVGVAAPIGTLLLAGFAMNALLGAGTSLLVVLSLEDPQRAAAALSWLVGGLAAKGWEHAALAAASLTVGLALAWPLAARFDVLSLGEATAASLAIDPRPLRRRALATMALLVGGAVSVAGAIPFVSLIVPHAARRLAGPGHARLLAVSATNGATLVLLADLAARSLRPPTELQAGILTACIGAPFFLSLLLSPGEDAHD